MKLLCDLLSEEAIVYPLEETGKWAAIEKCLRALPRIASGEIEFEKALESIRERETQEQTTLLENEVAIPHGILPDPMPLVCGMGISPDGIAYGPGGEKARIMFSILGSLSVRRDYLGVLAQIARLFRKSDFKEKILQAESSREVLRLIQEAERY